MTISKPELFSRSRIWEYLNLNCLAGLGYAASSQRSNPLRVFALNKILFNIWEFVFSFINLNEK